MKFLSMDLTLQRKDRRLQQEFHEKVMCVGCESTRISISETSETGEGSTLKNVSSRKSL